MTLFGINREQQLVKAFAKHDAQAMDRLYAEYAGYLTGVCARYIPNREDLHDVLQEAFIKIFTKISTFEYRGKGSLKAWLTRVVVNEALHFLRDKHTDLFVDTDNELPDVPESPPPNDLTSDQLMELIGQLPPGYRTVFNLFAIEGKSHNEIATLLNIKPATSASQYFKAKNMLATLVKQYINKENHP